MVQYSNNDTLSLIHDIYEVSNLYVHYETTATTFDEITPHHITSRRRIYVIKFCRMKIYYLLFSWRFSVFMALLKVINVHLSLWGSLCSSSKMYGLHEKNHSVFRTAWFQTYNAEILSESLEKAVSLCHFIPVKNKYRTKSILFLFF